MRDDGIATTAMLGLSGFRVLAVADHDGEVEQAIETTDEQGWRPGCGMRGEAARPPAELGAGSRRLRVGR